MIRHTKSAAVPTSLARGIPVNAANCAAFDADPPAYRSGTRNITIDKRIYGTKVVKRHLKADQQDKCAFCEAIFDANVAGDVEHFRPKQAIEGETDTIRPGYFWLGYAWENLCYACPDCNSYRKRERFPLAIEAARALDHHDDITLEEPLLLDAYGPRDPRDHIQFRGEAAIGLTAAGTATIDILALDRTALARDRLQHLQLLTTMRAGMLLLEHDTRPAAVAHVADVRAKLAAAILPNAKFSAAVADHLSALDAGENFLPVTTA